MHGTGEATVTTAPAQLPRAAWVLAWSYVAGQVLALVQRGAQPEENWPLSALLGVVIVTFFAHGVLRARMVRFWIVAVLSGIAAVLGVGSLLLAGIPEYLPHVVLTCLQLGCLVQLHRSPWFAWQRTRPEGGPSIAPLMVLAVVVGVLGGIIGADTSAVGADLEL